MINFNDNGADKNGEGIRNPALRDNGAECMFTDCVVLTNHFNLTRMKHSPCLGRQFARS